MSQAPQTRDRVVALPVSAADLMRQLSAARLEVEAAYAVARRLVYDRFPNGPVDRASLTQVQEDAISRLDATEQRLRRLRVASHTAGRRIIELD